MMKFLGLLGQLDGVMPDILWQVAVIVGFGLWSAVQIRKLMAKPEERPLQVRMDKDYAIRTELQELELRVDKNQETTNRQFERLASQMEARRTEEDAKRKSMYDRMNQLSDQLSRHAGMLEADRRTRKGGS